MCMASSVILGVTGCFVRVDRKEAGLTEAVSSLRSFSERPANQPAGEGKVP